MNYKNTLMDMYFPFYAHVSIFQNNIRIQNGRDEINVSVIIEQNNEFDIYSRKGLRK